MTLDDYVKGVVPAEMPASWSPEAVQAQAVAARTYAAWSRGAVPRPLLPDLRHLLLPGLRRLRRRGPAANAAVDATRGQILTYGGQPAFTQFSASSGGWTSAGSVPYLPRKGDPYDDWTGNPVHDWSVKVSATHGSRSAYPGIGDLKHEITARRSRRVAAAEWRRARRSGTSTLSGGTFRVTVGLRSSWFAGSSTSDSLLVHGS